MEQSGICATGNLHSTYLIFDAKPAQSRHYQLVLKRLADFFERVVHKHSESAVNTVIAVGANFWPQFYPDDRPVSLRPFPSISASEHELEADNSDLFISVRGDRVDINHLICMDVVQLLNPVFELVYEHKGFRFLDNRDLTGFVDGTENPIGPNRQSVALIPSGKPFASGSFLHVQHFVHQLSKWRGVPVEEQEQIIGRTKRDDVEFEADKKAEFAHTKRTNLKDEQGRTMEILRQSMPVGGSANGGLMFLSFCHTPEHFEKILFSMYEGLGGPSDKLLDYTRSHFNAAYFAPSVTFFKGLLNAS